MTLSFTRAISCLLILGLCGCPNPEGLDAGQDVPLADAPTLDSSTDSGERDGGPDDGGTDDGGADGGEGVGDVGSLDSGADPDACTAGGLCAPGSTDCVDDGTALRCLERTPCEYDWTAVACDPGETCGLLLDGRLDCAPESEHVCADAVVPVYGFTCPREGASYCTPDQGSAFVCRNTDADACLEVVVEPCVGADRCTNTGAGSCGCVANCMLGQTRCGLDLESVEVCGDSDGDGCLEFEPPVACPSGQTCLGSTGACSTTCTNGCTRVGPVGCYRSPVSVGTCGYFDSDPCLDLRFSPCPRELPVCDTGSRSCVECIGGIECAPAIEACVSHRCTPPAGTCYEGIGTTVTVPALTAMGDVSVFLGMRLPARMLVATIFLRHPDGTVVDIRTSALGDGYVDSMFTTVTGATQPEIAALSTHAPGGRWGLQIIPELGFPAELVTWAVCID